MGDFVQTIDTGAWDDISIAPDGSVWVLSCCNEVRQYSPTGEQLREWNLAPVHEFRDYKGMAAGAGGSIYVTESTVDGYVLHELDLDGNLESTSPIPAPLGRLVAVGTDVLYVVRTGPGGVVKLGRRVVAMEPTTWGQIKAGYRGTARANRPPAAQD